MTTGKTVKSCGLRFIDQQFDPCVTRYIGNVTVSLVSRFPSPLTSDQKVVVLALKSGRISDRKR